MLILTYRKTFVKLVKKNGSNGWVITSFDKREADDNKAVSDAIEPTHLTPTHTCHKTGATSLDIIIPKNQNKINMDGV